MKRYFSSLVRWKGGALLRLLPIAGLSVLLLFDSIALAAPQPPAQMTSSVRIVAGSQVTAGGEQPSIRQIPAAATPLCNNGDTAHQCANAITTKLGDWAGVAYQVGIWVAVVVALLVIIWTTPGAIFAAANNNSKLIGQLVIRIAIVAGLILLAVNAQTLLNTLTGNAASSISAPAFPTIEGGK